MAEDSEETEELSHPRKVLNAINAVIEKRATTDHDAYTVANGLSVTRMKITELLAWKTFYENEVRRENEAALLATGSRIKRKIHTRFV